MTGELQTGSLADLGKLPGMPSLPSLRRFILSRDDFPILERGKSGVAYTFDLAVAADFVRAHWIDGRRVEPQSDEARQLYLFEREDDHDRG